MTPRERLLATLLFRTPDRIPLEPGGGRKSTRERWVAEGMPADARDPILEAYRQVGGTLPWPCPREARFPVNERMIPCFEEKIIEERDGRRVVQDWKGNICEIGAEYTPEYLRNAIDFVTRRWIRCPVETREDWEELKRRYDADDPARLPPDAEAQGAALARRELPLTWHFSGPFWQMREWCGFEGLCMMMLDDPGLVHDMAEFWTDYIARLLERALQHVVPDMVHISEDMAYKGHSMISPAMTREFLLPAWRKWGEVVRGAGVPLYAMDSDGHVGDLIPLWIEAGINVFDPVEVAAGNDIVAYRRLFGRDMAFRGGVDKRAMAKGGATLRAEVDRIRPVIESGGYIPQCDHGVPPDVSWANFCETTRLLAKATGWL